MALQNSVTTKIQCISWVINSQNIIIHPIQSIHKTLFSIFIQSNATKIPQISAQKFFSILKYIRAKCQAAPGAPVFVLYLLASEMPQLGRTHNLTQGEGLYTVHNISATRLQGPPKRSSVASENLFASQREKEYSFTQGSNHTSISKSALAYAACFSHCSLGISNLKCRFQMNLETHSEDWTNSYNVNSLPIPASKLMEEQVSYEAQWSSTGELEETKGYNDQRGSMELSLKAQKCILCINALP